MRTLSFRYVLSKFELFHLRSEQEKVEAEVRERTKQREMAQYSARDSAAQMLDEIRFLRKHTPKAERPSLRDELPAAVEANLRVGHMLSGPLLEELRQGYHKWCKEEATQEVPRELRERILSGHCLSQVRWRCLRRPLVQAGRLTGQARRPADWLAGRHALLPIPGSSAASGPTTRLSPFHPFGFSDPCDSYPPPPRSFRPR